MKDLKNSIKNIDAYLYYLIGSSFSCLSVLSYLLQSYA